VFLPPEARPVVAALSIGIVALAIWDKVVVPPEAPPLHPQGAARVYGSVGAPVAQLDLSRGGTGAPDARSLDIAGPAPLATRVGDKLVPLQDDGGQAADQVPAATKPSARAAGQPVAVPPEQHTMTEEERSARNEAMFGRLEEQKKLMGMKVLPKKDADAGGAEPPEPLAAPVVRAPVPTLLENAKQHGAAAAADAEPTSGPGRLAPDAALVFTDESGVSSSWVLLGLPGAPPATDFTKERLVIIKPSATKILSVTPGPDAVTVVYRSLLPDEEPDPARDRVAALPAAPKTVLIYDASPR
jgi:hypothetical protein